MSSQSALSVRARAILSRTIRRTYRWLAEDVDRITVQMS
jgi:hypothetical protein